jgi:hypothetical protein
VRNPSTNNDSPRTAQSFVTKISCSHSKVHSDWHAVFCIAIAFALTSAKRQRR